MTSWSNLRRYAINKTLALLLTCCIFLFLGTNWIMAAEDDNDVDWDKIENNLFIQLKEERKISDAETYELIGNVHLHENRGGRAVLNFSKAVALDPKRYMSWYNLGLLTMENPEQCFKKAIEANPSFAPSYYWLASYYCKGNKSHESIKYFDLYLKTAKKDDPAEEERIRCAKIFINQMQTGETDYDIITEKSLQKSKK